MKVRFVAENPKRNEMYDQMLYEISQQTNTDIDSIRAYSERAFNAFGDKRFNTLFTESKKERSQELEQFKEQFYRYMKAIMPTESKARIAREISDRVIEDLFKTVK
jgi:signal transduction histidine kinase